jgi:acetylornithine/succinyldiaminopimelate/putrescine aminotransferase
VFDTGRFPLLAAAASTTLAQISEQGLIGSVRQQAGRVAAEIAELVEGFEFVRDFHHLGMILGMETDIASAEVVAAAAHCGLRLEVTGETSIQMQLPLALNDEDRVRLLDRLRESMERVERATAPTSV